jgi:hypothetical protein
MSGVAQVKKSSNPSDILFEHVNIEEELPFGTQEMVEEALADGLFKLWLADLKAKGQS